MRTTSIRLHLALSILLAVVQVGILIRAGVTTPVVTMSAYVIVGLLLLLFRTLALHRERRHRLLDILEAVRRGADGETDVRLSEGDDDEAGHVADAVNRLMATVRARALQAQAERDLDRLMVRETPNGLVVIDGGGVVRRASPALGRLLGFDADPVGRRPIETIPLPAFQYVIDEAARTREVSERSITHEGRELLLRAVPSSEGVGVLGVVLDLTSIGAAERVRREFVANVSHELRTPITAVVGYAEALDEERARLPEDVHPMVDAIRRNSERLRLLVEDVLHLSQIESRPHDVLLTRELVFPVIAAIVERFAPVAERRGVAFAGPPPSDMEALINADALEHALSNLVDNAVKYTPTGGTVRIRMIALDGAVEVWVEDTGPGIDAIHHPRIFERFYRVDPGRARALGGTGLGLALVKHLCSAMRAEIRLDSHLGRGSRFGLRLPVPNEI